MRIDEVMIAVEDGTRVEVRVVMTGRGAVLRVFISDTAKTSGGRLELSGDGAAALVQAIRTTAMTSRNVLT